MNKIVFFDTVESFENLLPLSYTRPVPLFRIGINTIQEKWQRLLPADYSYLTVEYLREKFPMGVAPDEVATFVAGCILPDAKLVEAIRQLADKDCMVADGEIVAYRGEFHDFEKFGNEPKFPKEGIDGVSRVDYSRTVESVRYVFDIFQRNGEEIKKDFNCIVRGESPIKPDPSVVIIGPAFTPEGLPSIYMEEGASAEGCVINVKNGPVYIGKDAEVMEGSCVRGPLAVCDHAKVRMGAKVYGSTTIGPYCKVGGEIDNAVMFGFSNKAHDGYLGNAVIGEWCNIGAGAVASNLKNDYSKVRIWNYHTQRFMRTDLQFCGLVMGDHSKAGINTMFNTASVVGVGVNLHGAGFPRTFIPSFSTGSPEGGFDNVHIDKFMETVGKVMARRGMSLNDVDRRIFETIYRSAARFK